MTPKENETESLRRERGEHQSELPTPADAGDHSQTAFGRGTFVEPPDERRTVDEDREAAERRADTSAPTRDGRGEPDSPT